jgi:Ran-binding protein 3
VLGKGDLDVKPSQPEGGEEAGAGVDEEPKAEGQTVGEVRRKVEKMTYEEGAEGAEGVGSAEDVVEDEDLQQEGPTGADVGDEQVTDGKDEWEEIGNAEADEARASEKDKEGKELKRKALDRSESSFAKDDETVVKRAKETPSVRVRSHLIPYLLVTSSQQAWRRADCSA